MLGRTAVSLWLLPVCWHHGAAFRYQTKESDMNLQGAVDKEKLATLTVEELDKNFELSDGTGINLWENVKLAAELAGVFAQHRVSPDIRTQPKKKQRGSKPSSAAEVDGEPSGEPKGLRHAVGGPAPTPDDMHSSDVTKITGVGLCEHDTTCSAWISAGMDCSDSALTWESQCPGIDHPGGAQLNNQTLDVLCPRECATLDPFKTPLPEDQFEIGASEGYLYSHVLKPKCVGDKQVGTVLVQLPYKESFQDTFIPGIFMLADKLCLALVVTINQGVPPSTGKFDYLRRASENGKMVVDTIKAQSWSNGVIIQLAPSGMCLTSVIADKDVAPQGQALMIGSNSLRQPVAFRGGAFNNGVMTLELASDSSAEAISILTMTAQTRESLTRDLLPNEGPTPFWDANRFDDWKSVTWPTIQMQGWWDIFNPEQFDLWAGLRKKSKWDVRSLHRMVISTQGHCGNGSSIPQIPMDAKADGMAGMIGMLQAGLLFVTMKDAWDGWLSANWAAHLAAYATLTKLFPPIVFYVMGTGGNYLSYGNDFPKTTPLPMTLASMNVANRKSASEYSYEYDPTDLVPTLGGYLFSGGACGSGDQSSLQSREDVLSFDGSVLEEPLAIMGTVTATLTVASNATDTDFFVKLVEVTPDGKRWLASEGLQRMRWRGGVLEPIAIEPGLNTVEIKLSATSWIFAKGSRVGIEIQSSNWPAIMPNPNTGLRTLSLFPETQANVTALNTVYASSFVTLPAVKLSDLPVYTPNFAAKAALDLVGKSLGR